MLRNQPNNFVKIIVFLFLCKFMVTTILSQILKVRENNIKDTNQNFLGGPKSGELLPEIKIDAGYLTDLLGEGFTIFCFNKDTAKKLEEIIPDGVSVVIIDILSRTSKLMKAENKSAYLIRPDGYIAARWKNITPEKIIQEFYKLIFKTEMSHDRK